MRLKPGNFAQEPPLSPPFTRSQQAACELDSRTKIARGMMSGKRFPRAGQHLCTEQQTGNYKKGRGSHCSELMGKVNSSWTAFEAYWGSYRGAWR
jgi:hypothetical protein